jgi:Nif-specific regulatory protein
LSADDIQLSALGTQSVARVPLPAANGVREVSLEHVEREHILNLLDSLDWNKSQAAQILGIERSTLDRKLKKYGVERPRP